MGLSNCFPSLPISKLKYPIYIYIATYSNTAQRGQPWVYNVSWWLLHWLICFSALIHKPQLKLVAQSSKSLEVGPVSLAWIEQLYIAKLILVFTMCDLGCGIIWKLYGMQFNWVWLIWDKGDMH